MPEQKPFDQSTVAELREAHDKPAAEKKPMSEEELKAEAPNISAILRQVVSGVIVPSHPQAKAVLEGLAEYFDQKYPAEKPAAATAARPTPPASAPHATR
jgi:hypothetical protein